MDVDFVFGRPLWALIDVEDGCVYFMAETKKECEDVKKWWVFGDMLDGKRKEYVIEREDRI